MRTGFFLFFLIFLLSCSIHEIETFQEEKPIVLYIDPGHGGSDGGTCDNGLVEKDINLSFSLILKEVLEASGYVVYLTRDTDIHLSENAFQKREDLEERINKIESSEADLFLSIHTNSFPKERFYGAQVFYHSNCEQNIFISSLIQGYFCEFTNTKRKIKPLDNILLLKSITIPGCLIELGFLSNKEEALLLKDSLYLRKMANLVVYGVNDFFLLT